MLNSAHTKFVFRALEGDISFEFEAACNKLGNIYNAFVTQLKMQADFELSAETPVQLHHQNRTLPNGMCTTTFSAINKIIKASGSGDSAVLLQSIPKDMGGIELSADGSSVVQLQLWYSIGTSSGHVSPLSVAPAESPAVAPTAAPPAAADDSAPPGHTQSARPPKPTKALRNHHPSFRKAAAAATAAREMAVSYGDAAQLAAFEGKSSMQFAPPLQGAWGRYAAHPTLTCPPSTPMFQPITAAHNAQAQPHPPPRKDLNFAVKDTVHKRWPIRRTGILYRYREAQKEFMSIVEAAVADIDRDVNPPGTSIADMIDRQTITAKLSKHVAGIARGVEIWYYHNDRTTYDTLDVEEKVTDQTQTKPYSNDAVAKLKARAQLRPPQVLSNDAPAPALQLPRTVTSPTALHLLPTPLVPKLPQLMPPSLHSKRAPMSDALLLVDHKQPNLLHAQAAADGASTFKRLATGKTDSMHSNPGAAANTRAKVLIDELFPPTMTDDEEQAPPSQKREEQPADADQQRQQQQQQQQRQKKGARKRSGQQQRSQAKGRSKAEAAVPADMATEEEVDTKLGRRGASARASRAKRAADEALVNTLAQKLTGTQHKSDRSGRPIKVPKTVVDEQQEGKAKLLMALMNDPRYGELAAELMAESAKQMVHNDGCDSD